MRLVHEAKRVVAQHEVIDAFERDVRAALGGGDDAVIERALHAFEKALLAHFSLEEELHFPALHGLDAALGSELRELEQDHAAFRKELTHLLRGGDGRSQARIDAFAALASALRRHEDREEALFQRSIPR
jgi:iron-sulfur cluster repair protein YtfE (RIC family)